MPEKVLIASSAQSELDVMCGALESSFTTDVIASPEDYSGNLAEYDLLLLDQNFTEFQGVDFLMTVLVGGDTPALVLSAPEDAKSAGEALNVGAFNFVVKSESYLDVLPFAISDAIKRFNDQKSMQHTIANLKKNVADLEMKATKVAVSSSASDVLVPVPSGESSLFIDVVATLKSGEINLPLYPEISNKFKELTSRGASVTEVTELLQKDASISSKMISVSNSSYYRGMAPIKTLEQAISRVGISETRNYVELISNRELYSTVLDGYKEYLEEEWKHSLCCGYVSQELSRVMQIRNPAELFAMGLFHGLGKNLLIQILSLLENNGTYTGIEEDVWRPLIEKHYCQFGASLMKKWNLSQEYWQVAKWHLDPSEAGESISEELNMVSLANVIAKDMGYPDAGYEVAVDYSELKAVADLKITPVKIEKIKASVTEMMNAGLAI